MAAFIVDFSKVREFANQAAFYRWLAAHHDDQSEVWIKIHKVRSGRKSITPAQAIDAALCWGWIDGIRKGFDEDSFLQRYTPRRKRSIWSQINVANVARLIAEGRMTEHGLVHVEAAKADGRWDRAYTVRKGPRLPAPAKPEPASDASGGKPKPRVKRTGSAKR